MVNGVKKMKTRIGSITLLVFWLISLVGAYPVNAATASGDINDPHDLETFWDEEINNQLQTYHIAGAAVSVVKDGKLVFSKGYGYADLASQKPVSAGKTLFRAGSIGKLFTATAVMQLAEQGKLDLNADINTYLKDFKIPATFPQPITLANLLTHTSGLDGAISGTFVPSAADIKPLGDFLAKHLRPRVYAPGQVAAYSNYGFALAGYIVEQVSGMPLDKYIDQNIFQPLGMDHSSISQPLPANLAPDMSTGYASTGSKPVPQPFEYVQPWPAGSMSTSVEDIARFMIANLQDGSYNGGRILQPATLKDMHSLHFQAAPQASGMDYGFEQEHLNGLDLLTKGGDTIFFHSLMVLVPSQNAGFYVTYNSSGATRPHLHVLQPFLDRYFPDPAGATSLPNTGLNARANSARLAGAYLISEISLTNYQKILSLANTAFLNTAPDGALTGPDQYFDDHRFVEVAPQVYRQEDGQETLIFHSGPGGVEWMSIGNLPMVEFERLPWYETPFFTLGLLAACLIIFLTTLIAWPIAALVNRRRGQACRPGTRAWPAGWLGLPAYAAYFS